MDFGQTWLDVCKHDFSESLNINEFILLYCPNETYQGISCPGKDCEDKDCTVLECEKNISDNNLNSPQVCGSDGILYNDKTAYCLE